MKNLISILLSMTLVMTIAGCGDSLEDNVDNKQNDNKVVEQTPEKDEEKVEEDVYTLTIGETYGDMTLLYNGRSLSEMTLNTDGTVQTSSCAAEGGCMNLRGTYRIEGNNLIVTFTERYPLYEWEPIENVTDDLYIIIGDNTFKESDSDRVYELYS